MSRKVALATDLRRSPSPFTFSTHLLADDATFQPCSPRALSSLKVVGDHFKDFFPLSKNFTDKQPPYYGFFTEDEFIGGHVSLRAVNSFISLTHPVSQPQFFASFNSAEQLYDALMT